MFRSGKSQRIILVCEEVLLSRVTTTRAATTPHSATLSAGKGGGGLAARYYTARGVILKPGCENKESVRDVHNVLVPDTTTRGCEYKEGSSEMFTIIRRGV